MRPFFRSGRQKVDDHYRVVADDDFVSVFQHVSLGWHPVSINEAPADGLLVKNPHPFAINVYAGMQWCQPGVVYADDCVFTAPDRDARAPHRNYFGSMCGPDADADLGHSSRTQRERG